jgi:hypothetical protein
MLILILLVVQSVTALWGGWNLMVDASGARLQMPVSWLGSWGFSDYAIPGVVLFTLLGCGSALTALTLLLRMNIASRMVRMQGIIVICWIAAQFLLVHGVHVLQFVYAGIGLVLVFSARRC